MNAGRRDVTFERAVSRAAAAFEESENRARRVTGIQASRGAETVVAVTDELIHTGSREFHAGDRFASDAVVASGRSRDAWKIGVASEASRSALRVFEVNHVRHGVLDRSGGRSRSC